MNSEHIINEFFDIYQNGKGALECDEVLMIMLIDRLDRIADAVNDMQQSLGCIDSTADRIGDNTSRIDDSLSKLANCVAEGGVYGTRFYIAGDVTT